MKKNIICIISGPTASGKTATSINLAKKFGGEIVNFDSLLFYKELNIGTAKPTVTEQQGIPHHLIDMASISHSINAADYIKLTLPIIEKIHNENKIVLVSKISNDVAGNNENENSKKKSEPDCCK